MSSKAIEETGETVTKDVLSLQGKIRFNQKTIEGWSHWLKKEKGGNDSVHWKLVGSYMLRDFQVRRQILGERKPKIQKTDFYGNDDDSFLDSTDLVEKKPWSKWRRLKHWQKARELLIIGCSVNSKRELWNLWEVKSLKTLSESPSPDVLVTISRCFRCLHVRNKIKECVRWHVNGRNYLRT